LLQSCDPETVPGRTIQAPWMIWRGAQPGGKQKACKTRKLSISSATFKFLSFGSCPSQKSRIMVMLSLCMSDSSKERHGYRHLQRPYCHYYYRVVPNKETFTRFWLFVSK
jgi:hypothetical protein